MFAELDQPGELFDNATKVKEEPLASRAIIVEDQPSMITSKTTEDTCLNINESTKD